MNKSARRAGWVHVVGVEHPTRGKQARRHNPTGAVYTKIGNRFVDYKGCTYTWRELQRRTVLFVLAQEAAKGILNDNHPYLNNCLERHFPIVGIDVARDGTTVYAVLHRAPTGVVIVDDIHNDTQSTPKQKAALTKWWRKHLGPKVT